jgi:RNA polymerase sigma-70 factor (ECF subfamily)
LTRDVIARAQAGDRAALEELLAEIAPMVHRFGVRMCKNAHDADDVLQDTLISMVDHLGEFEGRSSLGSWVFTLARTACARRRRGLKNRPPVDDAHLEHTPTDAPSPEEGAAGRELEVAFARALDGLSDEHREVIQLRDVEGLTAPETAEVLGIGVDAVKSRLHRAREALRAALAPLRDAPPPTCPDVAAMWSAKLEGDLSPTDCSTMEAHLRGCARCSAACDGLRRALVACSNARTAPVPAEVQASVRAALRVLSAR